MSAHIQRRVNKRENTLTWRDNLSLCEGWLMDTKPHLVIISREAKTFNCLNSLFCKRSFWAHSDTAAFSTYLYFNWRRLHWACLHPVWTCVHFCAHFRSSFKAERSSHKSTLLEHFNFINFSPRKVFSSAHERYQILKHSSDWLRYVPCYFVCQEASTDNSIGSILLNFT